jgi:hypothetical protein
MKKGVEGEPRPFQGHTRKPLQNFGKVPKKEPRDIYPAICAAAMEPMR